MRWGLGFPSADFILLLLLICRRLSFLFKLVLMAHRLSLKMVIICSASAPLSLLSPAFPSRRDCRRGCCSCCRSCPLPHLLTPPLAICCANVKSISFPFVLKKDKGYDFLDLPLPLSVMEGAVSDAKTALGSEQLNCLKALTALRIAYFNQNRLLH